MTRFAPWLLLVLVVSCQDSSPQPGPTSARAPALAPAPAPTLEPAPAPAARPGHLTEREVAAALERWLRAQNEGDLATYDALYAPRFEGVKRSGPRTRRFDRKGWMHDRGRMFKKPMRVRAEEVHVATTSASATVDFVQHWASGTYADRGPKRQVWVRTDAGLAIAREEMLRSDVNAGEAGGPPAPGTFMYVSQIGAPHVVLGRAPVEAGQGPRRLLDRGAVVAVLGEATVPKPLRTLQGEAVQLYGSAGRVCARTLGPVRLVRRVAPHFGTRMQWDGQGEDGTGAVAADADVARDAWDSAEGSDVWVAPLQPAEPCEGALWGRLQSLPEPLVLALQPEDADTTRTTWARFRQSAAWKGEQRLFERDFAGKGPWDAHDAGEQRVRVFRAADRSLTTIVASAGTGCGEYLGRLWTAWDGDQQRTGPGDFQQPLAVMDLERDGTLELLATDDGFAPTGEPTQLLRLAEDGVTSVENVEPPNHDCGC